MKKKYYQNGLLQNQINNNIKMFWKEAYSVRCLTQYNKGVTNSMEQSFSWEAFSHSASQEMVCVLWNFRLSTMSTRATHWTLTQARWILSTPLHPVSSWSILVLPSHICPSLASDLFPSALLTKILFAFLISPINVTYHQGIEYDFWCQPAIKLFGNHKAR